MPTSDWWEAAYPQAAVPAVSAGMALQEASEANLVGLFEDTNLCTISVSRANHFQPIK